MKLSTRLIIITIYAPIFVFCTISWDDWWTYDGISGPAFWGLINPEWSVCSKGKRQSPINLEPDKLLFDQNLTPLQIDTNRVNGVIENTGHSIKFTPDWYTVNITGGPLSYKYQFYELHIRFGQTDDVGSEHTINRYTFPAELQLYAFNNNLYRNRTEAAQHSYGLTAIAIMIQIGNLSNPELRLLTDQIEKLKFRGNKLEIRHFSMAKLMPQTDFYMTYEGSISMPACHETVTWIIMNKPVYITKQQLHLLRDLQQNESNDTHAPLANNLRTIQPTYNRPVRTNIHFYNASNGSEEKCVVLKKQFFYQGITQAPKNV